MPPPRALKRLSWKSYAAGLFFNAAAEHVYIIFPYSITLWGRGKHDPSRHLSPDRRTRMGRIKISIMPPITLKVRRNRADKSSWKFCRVGSFIDKNDVKFWLVSSFDLCQVLLVPPPNFTYGLSLEIQKYRLQCGWIYEIMENIGQMLPTAYEVRPHFWAYAFWSSGKPLLPGCGCVLIVDAYLFVPPPAAVIDISIHLSRPPEAKNRCLSSCSKSSIFDKNSS